MLTIPDSLVRYLETQRTFIEAALVAALPVPPDVPAHVAAAMRYSVAAGGKRLRPILCLASAEAVGGERAAAISAACAVELIHTYSLIHDDLPAMDDDSMRRGRPTLHVVMGEGMAILGGDALLTEAFHLLARSPGITSRDHDTRRLRVIAIVAAAAGAAGMVGGQAIDLMHAANRTTGEAPLPLDDAGLQAMHAKKTGALIRAAACAGAVMGGGSDGQVAAIDQAAAELGLAFQIVDDILDVEGTSAHLGKTAGKDAAAGKVTYPALHGLAASRRMAEECVDRAETALNAPGIDRTRLLQIARWIVTRTS